MSNIELNVVALGNFKGLQAELAALDKQIKAMNASLASNQTALTTKQLSGLTNAFNQAMVQSGQFTAKTVSMATAAENLGQRLAKSKTGMNDYRNAMKSVTKETSLYNQLGQRQVAMQQSIVQNLGNGMARVYAQHNADLSNAATRSRVLTQAIIAQNTALMQGATKVINWGKNMQWAGRQLTAGLTMPMALFSAGIAKMYNDIDKNLTRMERVYGIGLEKPTKATLEAVRKDVIGLSKELGHQLGISATEVTDTAAQFAAAGLTGKELLGATEQAARMVVLGETDKQEAIKATIALQTAYKMETKDLAEATNFFNAAQAATSTSMTDLIEAIPRTGPVIRGLGGTYKDMVAILTAMKEGGVPAGEAANAIKNSLGRIINPTKAAQERLGAFGINLNAIVNKNAGNLVGTLTELQHGLDKLSSLDRQRAIAELFGKFQFARMAAFMDNFNKTGTQSAKVIEMMGLSAADLAGIAEEQTKKIQESASGKFKIAVEDLKNTLIPMGEAALNVFTRLLEGLQNVFEYIKDLPAPIKSFIKIFGGIALIAGPVIMITGLFGNLIGQIGKGLVNLRTLGVSIITSGVNPLRTLGKQFRVTTEEMVAESNATQIFGSKMSAATGPIESVTLAINELIAAMQRLNVTNVSTPLQNVQKAASAMGTGAALSSRYQSTLFGQQLTKEVTGGGEATTVGRRSTTGTLMFPRGSGAATSQGALGDTSLVYSTEAQRKSLMEKGKSLGISAQIMKQLTMSEEDMLQLEARHLASLQLINQNDPKFIATYKALQTEYQKELALAKTASTKKQINQKYQDQINALLAKQPNFSSMVNTEMQRQRKALSEGVTHEQLMADNLKRATTESRLTATKVKGLNDAMDRTGWTLRAAAQNFVTKSVTMLGMASKGFSAERSHVIAAAAMDKALMAENKLTQATTTLAAKRTTAASGTFLGMPGMGAPGVGLTGAGKQIMSPKMQMGISGIGMGASLAGGFMMGSENKAVAMGGQSLMAGGMAASMLPMLGASAAMTGGLTAIIAAIPLLIAGFNHLKTESEKSAAAIRGAMGAVTDDFKALGMEVSPLTNALPPFDEKIGVAVDAVGQFIKAIEDASETSEMKAFAESLKDMTNEQKRAALEQKARSLAAGGATQAQVGTAIKGYMGYAGIFESVQPYIVAAFDEGGQILSTTLTSAITGAFANSQTGLSAGGQYGNLSTLTLSEKFGITKAGGVGGAISDITDTLVPSLQGLIQNSDLSTLISQLDELASSPAFKDGTNGAAALDQAIFKLTENSDDLNTLRKALIEAGRSPQEQMIFLKAAINGLGGSIQNLPKLTTLQVKVLINQQEASNAAKNVFGDIASRAVSTSNGKSGSGGGSGESTANKAIDKKIEKLKDTIDLIKEEQKERKRLLDLQQKEEDFAKTKMGIENQIREALSSGDFLKVAELKNELAVVEAKKTQTDQQNALDLADEKRIKDLEDQIDALNKKKKNGKGGGGDSAIDEVQAQEDLSKKLQASYDKTKQLIDGNDDLILSYGEFKTRPEVKSFIKLMEDNKATPKEIGEKLVEMYASYTPTKDAIKGSQEFADSFALKMQAVKNTEFSPQEWKNKSALATEEALRGAQEKIDKAKVDGPDFDVTPNLKQFSSSDLAALYKQLGKGFSGVGSVVIKAAGGMIGYATGGMVKYANGSPGPVTGPGGPTSDMVPALLSNGEYVIKASSVNKYGSRMLSAINSGTFDIPKLKQPSFNMPSAPLGSGSTQGIMESMGAIHNENTNNVTINADFNITGGADPKRIAEEVMQKIQITMKKSGTGNRI